MALWLALGLYCVSESLVPLTIVIEKVNSGHSGALGRLSLALLSGLVGVLAVVLASRISPRVERYVMRGNIALLLLAAMDLVLRGLDQDELPHLHFSWQIGHGLLPFRDFFEFHHMFWNALASPLLLLMDGDLRVVVVAKFLILGLTLTALLGAAYLAREMGGWPEVTVLTGLTLTELMLPGTEFRADPSAALMCVAALVLVQRNRPATAGVCAGVAILIIQKALLTMGLLGLCMLAFPPQSQGGRWRPAWRFALATAAVASLYFLWAAAHGIFTEYIRCCYVYPAAFVKVLRPPSIWKSSLVVVLRHEFLGYPWMTGGSLVGLLVLLRRTHFPRLLGVVSVLCWVLAFVTAISFRQYLMFPNILLLVLTGVGAARLRPRGSILAPALPLMALCLCTYLSLLRWAADPPMTMDLNDATIALTNAASDETFYGEQPLGSLGNPIFRHDATYYGTAPVFFSNLFRRAGVTPAAGDPADLKQLVAHPPKVMIFATPDREEEALRILSAAGTHYRKEGNVLIRIP